MNADAVPYPEEMDTAVNQRFADKLYADMEDYELQYANAVWLFMAMCMQSIAAAKKFMRGKGKVVLENQIDERKAGLSGAGKDFVKIFHCWHGRCF
jgi:serine protease inhibitor